MRSLFPTTLQNPELLPPSASDCAARRPLTKSEEEETIIINRPGRSTYPDEKSVLTSGATPLFEVDYREDYPEYPFPAAQTEGAIIEVSRALLFRKAPGWRYEEEFRSIRVIEPGPGHDMGLIWDGQVATLPTSALVGVTLGAAMPENVRSELVREIADVRPSLEIWQAHVKDREYGLDFHRVR